MSVRKFRSAADMPAPPPLTPLDPENLRMACELSTLELLRPVRRTPGVRKFRSVGEMSRAQERAEAESAVVNRPLLPPETLDMIRRIAAQHGVREVRVFGSFVRGEQRPESDLDLLIHLEKGRGFSDLLGFCDEVESALGRHVDVVTDDGLSPFIRDRVLAEAVPL